MTQQAIIQETTLAELQLALRATPQIMPMDQFERERQKLRAEYAQIIALGAKTAIHNEATLEHAVQIGKLLQTATKQFADFYKPVKQAYDAQKATVTDKEKVDTAEIKTVKDALAAKVLAYQTEQEKLRLEEQRLARIEAARIEEERRIEEAIALEAEGFVDEAALRLEEDALPPPVIISTPVARKISGSVTRTTWKAEVTNLKLLINAVAAGQVPVLALTANLSFLNKQATDYCDGLQYPGVSVHKEVSNHFRS